MALVPWLGINTTPAYPFSDPLFQNFNVQQYLTVAGVNPIQTYDAPAPKEIENKEEPAEKTTATTKTRSKAGK